MSLQFRDGRHWLYTGLEFSLVQFSCWFCVTLSLYTRLLAFPPHYYSLWLIPQLSKLVRCSTGSLSCRQTNKQTNKQTRVSLAQREIEYIKPAFWFRGLLGWCFWNPRSDEENWNNDNYIWIGPRCFPVSAFLLLSIIRTSPLADCSYSQNKVLQRRQERRLYCPEYSSSCHHLLYKIYHVERARSTGEWVSLSKNPPHHQTVRAACLSTK